MRKLGFGNAVLACVLLMGLHGEVVPAKGCGQDPLQPVPLLRILEAIGQRHDVYLTVESAWADGESSSGFASEMITPWEEGTSLEAELQLLSLASPRFTYVLSASNPDVIHIIDARLVRGSEYGLDSTIAKFDFDGTTSEIVVEIGKLGIPVQNPEGYFTHELLWVDLQTHIRVRAEEIAVRDVLSNYFPLEGRGHILWTARTKMGNGEKSVVTHWGPPARAVELPNAEF